MLTQAAKASEMRSPGPPNPMYHVTTRPLEGDLSANPTKRNYPTMPTGVYLWDDPYAADMWRIKYKRRNPHIYQVDTNGFDMEPDIAEGLGSGQSAWRVNHDVPADRIREIEPHEWSSILYPQPKTAKKNELHGEEQTHREQQDRIDEWRFKSYTGDDDRARAACDDQQGRCFATNAHSEACTTRERDGVFRSPQSNISLISAYSQSIAHKTGDELHVGLGIPKPIAIEIHNWAEEQDWPEGTELEPIGEYHITMLYSPEGHSHKDDPWMNHESHAVSIKGIKAFPSKEREDKDAIVLTVDSETIQTHHNELAANAEEAGIKISPYSFDDFKPHMTIAYGSLPSGLKPPKLTFETVESSVSEPRDDTIDDDDSRQAGLLGHFAAQPTLEEFEADPNTLWHGTPHGVMGEGPIHIGTKCAAEEALRARMLGHGDYQGKPPGTYWDLGEPIPKEGFKKPWWKGEGEEYHQPPGRNPRLIPVQLGVPASEHIYPDVDVEGDGFGWEEALRHAQEEAIAYRNEGEDAGSISYVVPHRGMLRAHPDAPLDRLASVFSFVDVREPRESAWRFGTAPRSRYMAELLRFATTYDWEDDYVPSEWKIGQSTAKIADSWQPKTVWPNALRERNGEPVDADCTCKDDEKLDCPVHGMHPVLPTYDDTLEFPNPASPVGYDYRGDGPRTWLQTNAGLVSEYVVKTPSEKWLNQPTELYHAAPSVDRERIRAHGLQVADPRLNWEINEQSALPEGVYGHSNLQDAQDYAQWLEEQRGIAHDIWRIPSEELHGSLMPDPDIGDTAWYVTKPIRNPELIGGPENPEQMHVPQWTPSAWHFGTHPWLQDAGPMDEFTEGPFWHITHDPNFKIDPDYVPTDLSSMAEGADQASALMVSDEPHMWAGTFHSHPEDLANGEYENDEPRIYAAEIEPIGPFRPAHRGFGPEYYMENPAQNARVKRVVPLEQALMESDPSWQPPQGGWDTGWRLHAKAKTKLWLDDSRRPPDKDWAWARNVAEAQKLLQTDNEHFVIMSLDHDLGMVQFEGKAVINPDALSGGDFILWLIEHGNKKYMPKKVTLHTHNHHALEVMYKALEPHTEVKIERAPDHLEEEWARAFKVHEPSEIEKEVVHLPEKSGNAQIMYHAAPVEVRDQIAREGLTKGTITESELEARDHGENYYGPNGMESTNGYDLWHVDPRGLDLTLDPDYTNAGIPGAWEFGHIDPSRLRLAHQAFRVMEHPHLPTKNYQGDLIPLTSHESRDQYYDHNPEWSIVSSSPFAGIIAQNRHQLAWLPHSGIPGKGLVTPSGDVHTWPVDANGAPHHSEYMDVHAPYQLGEGNAHFFNIRPRGGLDTKTHLVPPAIIDHIMRTVPSLRTGEHTDWHFGADESDTREYDDARQMPPITQAPNATNPHPEKEGCTCPKGEKLTCPVHGLNPDPTQQGYDHSWSIPEGSPVGYPESGPRNYYMKAEGSVEDRGDYDDGKTAQQADGPRAQEKAADSRESNEKKSIGIDHVYSIAGWHLARWICPKCETADNDECACHLCGYNMHTGEHDWHEQTPGSSKNGWSGLPRAEGAWRFGMETDKENDPLLDKPKASC